MRKLFQLLFTALLLAAFNQSLPACKPYDTSENLKQVDTLERLVKRIDETLILDEEVLAGRRDSMQIKLDVILKNLPDNGNAETRSDLIKYTGIRSNYINVLENYPVVNFDFEEHKENVKQLKEKLVNKDITPAEFEGSYQDEKKALEAINDQAKELAFITYSVEPEYQRVNKEVTKIYHFYTDKAK